MRFQVSPKNVQTRWPVNATVSIRSVTEKTRLLQRNCAIFSLRRLARDVGGRKLALP